MSSRKTYFVLPTSDYNASHIQLGSIISDIRLPYRALSPALTPVPKIHTAWKEDYILGLSKALSASLGIQTQFLAQLGSPLGADIHVTGETANASTWLIKRLETEFIEPDHHYVEESVLKVPDVKKYLEARKLTGAVYMVTGIKIVCFATGHCMAVVWMDGIAAIHVFSLLFLDRVAMFLSRVA